MVEGSPSSIVRRWLHADEETHQIVEFDVLERIHCLALHEVWPVADEEALAMSRTVVCLVD